MTSTTEPMASDNEDTIDPETTNTDAADVDAQKAVFQALDLVGTELEKTLSGHAAGKFFFFKILILGCVMVQWAGNLGAVPLGPVLTQVSAHR